MIEEVMKKYGWCECNFIDCGFDFVDRIGNF